MTPERAEVLAHVAALLPTPRRPVLVVVDGPDGVGKTWFADELASELADRLSGPVVRASVDDFHHPREHRHALGRTGETVWARSFDYRAFRRELLEPWLRGAGSSYRRRWHDLDSDGLVDDAHEVVPEGGVLLVDGVFTQRPELYAAWDLTVWLEAPPEVSVPRLAGRDGGSPDPAHPDQARYVDAQRIYRDTCDPPARADIVIDHTDLDRPRIVGEARPTRVRSATARSDAARTWRAPAAWPGSHVCSVRRLFDGNRRSGPGSGSGRR